MFLKRLEELPSVDAAIGDASTVTQMREGILGGSAYVFRGAYSREKLHAIRDYLAQIGRSSLPNYESLRPNAPNFHRVYGDPRSYVQGRFHQFSFFPWNLDVLGLFGTFRGAYVLNNRINQLADETYLGTAAENDCIARLTFQHYPKGVGYIAQHQDVAGPHKFTTVLLTMSDKGSDYSEGGGYVATGETSAIRDLDSELYCGDLLFIHSEVVHGVECIDPDAQPEWLSFEGKWTLVLAVNKLEGTTSIANSKALDAS